MRTRSQLTTLLLGAALAFTPALVFGQDQTTPPDHPSAKQDMKNAGRDTKDAARNAGRATKRGTKKVYHSTKRHSKHAWNRTKNAARGTKNGAKNPNPPATTNPQ